MGCHFLLQGHLPDSGIEPASSALAGSFFTTAAPGKPHYRDTEIMKAEGRSMDGHKRELEEMILNFSDISFTNSHLCSSCTLFPFVPLKTDFFLPCAQANYR